MNRWLEVRLAEEVEINPKLPKKIDASQWVSFVPMAAVDEIHGVIADRQEKTFEAVSKGFPTFINGDVLFAKITPCMENGKAAIACDLVNGIGAGSTEFFVLRPSRNVLPEYVFHFVRRRSFRESCKANFTGSAGQQRVPRSYLENVQFRLPPLDEQRRIVSLLDRAADIRRRADAARAKARAVIPALFLDMFGDPATNPKGWARKALGDLGELDRGRSRHRPRNAPELYGGPYPFVQTGDVANSKGRIRHHDQSYSKAGLAQSKMWPSGTLCITIAANIGKTGILEFDACFPDSVVGFTPGSAVTSEFIQSSLNFMQAEIEERAPQAAQKNINLQVLRRLEMACPPLPLQTAFAEQARRIEATARALDAAAVKAEAIAAALSHEIFG